MVVVRIAMQSTSTIIFFVEIVMFSHCVCICAFTSQLVACEFNLRSSLCPTPAEAGPGSTPGA